MFRWFWVEWRCLQMFQKIVGGLRIHMPHRLRLQPIIEMLLRTNWRSPVHLPITSKRGRNQGFLAHISRPFGHWLGLHKARSRSQKLWLGHLSILWTSLYSTIWRSGWWGTSLTRLGLQQLVGKPNYSSPNHHGRPYLLKIQGFNSMEWIITFKNLPILKNHCPCQKIPAEHLNF